MAVIKLRRGAYSQFDPTKLDVGEVALPLTGDPATTDGKSMYIGFGSGEIKRIPFSDELTNVNQEAAAAAQDAEAAQLAAERASSAAESTKKFTIEKAEEIQNSNAATDELSRRAMNKTNELENEIASTANRLDSANERITRLDTEGTNYAADGFVENGVAYFVNKNGDILFQITGIGGGGGGGGDVSPAVMTATNTSGWLSKTIPSGASCEASFTWSSLENDMPTGAGFLRIYVNKVIKSTKQVQQGTVVVDVGPYLGVGSNTVKAEFTDVYGNVRSLSFSVTVALLSLTSPFDTTQPFTGPINFPYTPVGAVSKIVHFLVDGNQVGTVTTDVSNRQLTYTIPAQTHGAHSLSVYFTAELNGEAVQSNELYYEFIYLEELNNNTIIMSPFKTTSVSQYTTLHIPYTVYTPNSLTSEVQLFANNVLQNTITVDRTEQVFTYRADTAGTVTFKIKCGNTERTFTVTITELDIDVEAETNGLALYLTSYGRSNQEAHPETWTYGTGANQIAATLSNFNFTSDGWQKDNDGITVLRCSGDARVTIPYQPFATDFRTTGKTIEIEFATRDVLNYDAIIMSCFSGDRGFKITAQKALLKSEQSEISTQYKEDEHVRVAFTVEKRSENRLIYIYINGVASGVVQYPIDDDFAQSTPVNISIGSNDCTMDIYCIRVYDNNLSMYQIVDNWIADTQIGALMLERYTRNNVFDTYGNIVIENLPTDLPYMIRSGAELPQYKGDKKTISVTFIDPMLPSRSFMATNVQTDVQGTSSQYYERKNYKDKYKNGFTLSQSGTHVDKFAMNSNAVPVNTFTVKADVASSEGANNVLLAMLYNDACPYKTPYQVTNNKVRQGIEGFPIVQFWDDGNETKFLGRGNFNNDKGTEEVFGFTSPDESWEIKNNTGNRVIWKSDDYSGTDWLNDFEARYPDTDPPYTDPSQLKEFATWVKSTDTTAATNENLPSAVTYGETTYTKDTAAYRLAKFKAEAGNYMEMQSALFYYLFTELFLMVDSRAKNAFPSFMGSEVND